MTCIERVNKVQRRATAQSSTRVIINNWPSKSARQDAGSSNHHLTVEGFQLRTAAATAEDWNPLLWVYCISVNTNTHCCGSFWTSALILWIFSLLIYCSGCYAVTWPLSSTNVHWTQRCSDGRSWRWFPLGSHCVGKIKNFSKFKVLMFTWTKC